MEGRPRNENKLKSLKSEHLNEGVRPIYVCLDETPKVEVKQSIIDLIEQSTSENVLFLDYNMRTVEEMDERNFAHPGEQGYVISPVSGNDKYSEGFFDCTGLVVVGVDSSTGENISVLSHQKPLTILNTHSKLFRSHLRERLIELQKKCKPGTIDAVLVGGNRSDIIPNIKESIPSGIFSFYPSIELLSNETEAILGFEPIFVGGPKGASSRETDNVYFDNKERRLHLFRAGEINAQDRYRKKFHKEFANYKRITFW